MSELLEAARAVLAAGGEVKRGTYFEVATGEGQVVAMQVPIAEWDRLRLAAETTPCALVDPKPDRHGHLSCDRCQHLSTPWLLSDLCTSPEGLEARADALTSEALAEAENLRRKAVELRGG